MFTFLRFLNDSLFKIIHGSLKEFSQEFMREALGGIMDKMGKRVPYDQLTPEDAARLKEYLEKVVNAVMRQSFDRAGGDCIGVQATLKWLSKVPIGRHRLSEFLPDLFVLKPDGKFDLTVFTFTPWLQDDLYPIDIKLKITELHNNIENIIRPSSQNRELDSDRNYLVETTNKITQYQTLLQESEQKLQDAVEANATALCNSETLDLADSTVNKINKVVAKASRVDSELVAQMLKHQDQRNLDALPYSDPVSPSSQFNNAFGITSDQLSGRSNPLPFTIPGSTTNTVPLIGGIQSNSEDTEINSPKKDTLLDKLLNTPEKPFEKHSLLDLPFVYHKGLEGVFECGVWFLVLRPSLLIGLVSLCKALYDFQARKLYDKCTAQKMTPYKAFLALWMYHHVKYTLWCPITTVRLVLGFVLMLDTIDPDFPGTVEIPADVSHRPRALTFAFNMYWLFLMVCMPAILVSSIWLTVCIPFQKKLMKKFYKDVGFPAMVFVVCSIVSFMIFFMYGIFDHHQQPGFLYYLFKVVYPTLMNKLLWDFSFWDSWRK